VLLLKRCSRGTLMIVKPAPDYGNGIFVGEKVPKACRYPSKRRRKHVRNKLRVRHFSPRMKKKRKGRKKSEIKKYNGGKRREEGRGEKGTSHTIAP